MKRTVAIIPMSDGETMLWQRVIQTSSGAIIQVFPFRPDEETEDWLALMAIGPDFWENELNAKVWNASNLQTGSDPAHTIKLYPVITNPGVFVHYGKASIQRGIEELHKLIDENLEVILEDAGDTSYIPVITDATNAVFSGDKSNPFWYLLNRQIETEWDRLLMLYYTDGLRGESLLQEAKKR